MVIPCFFQNVLFQEIFPIIFAKKVTHHPLHILQYPSIIKVNIYKSIFYNIKYIFHFKLTKKKLKVPLQTFF